MRPKTFTLFTPQFYTCKKCHNLMILIGNIKSEGIMCCDEQSQKLSLQTEKGNLLKEHLPIMKVTGGIKHSIAHITIGETEQHLMTEKHHIEWIYFQGRQGNGQFQYLRPGDQAAADFALAGNDAYAYCNRDICMMGRGCKFCCRSEFDIYVYCNVHGLWKITT